MKIFWTIAITFTMMGAGYSQNKSFAQQSNKKGQVYFYWGWNLDGYSKSNIQFEGADYNFTLKDVVAKHRPTPLSVSRYLNPLNVTIPQYNFRIGYFIRDNINISFGFDHMKYVVQQNQQVKISGRIENTETQYDGIYSNDNILIEEGFLALEHTDGLNYLNLELRKMSELFSRKNIGINLVKGAGIGLVIPRTDATFINNIQHDKFHLAGYGIAGVAGVNASIRKHFFVQTEFKTGFINMPWIRTTSSEVDKASQHFFFYQFNLVLGTTINFKKEGKLISE